MFNDESNKTLDDNTQENVSIKTNDKPAVNNNTVVEKEQVKSNIIEITIFITVGSAITKTIVPIGTLITSPNNIGIIVLI